MSRPVTSRHAVFTDELPPPCNTSDASAPSLCVACTHCSRSPGAQSMCAYCDRVTRTIDWVDGAVELIDQTRLPDKLVVLRVEDVPTLVEAIRRLAVRGAPALGVAGAFGVVLALREPDYASAVRSLRNARPTAVNLARMVDRVAARAVDGFEAALAEALAVRDEEIAASRLMGERGAELVQQLVGDGRVRAVTSCK